MFRFRHRSVGILFLAAASFLRPGHFQAQQREVSPSEALINKGVDPCVDFYAYACGDWVATRAIPADQERIAVFGDLIMHNRLLLQRQLEDAATAPRTSSQKMYGSFYRECLDTTRMNADDLGPVQPTLHAIAHLSSVQNIAGLLADRTLLANGLVKIKVERDRQQPERWIPVLEPAPLTLPAAQDYLANTPAADRHRTALKAYMRSVFLSLGDTEQVAQRETRDVLSVETALAKGELSPAETRDPIRTYNPLSLEVLETSNQTFSWSRYLAALDLPPTSTINLEQPGYLWAVENALRTLPLSAWQSYLRIESITPLAPYLSSPIRDAAFQLFQKDLRGVAAMEPREQTCTALTDQQLGDAVGQDWLKQNLPEERRQLAMDVLDHLRDALKEELAQQPWLSAPARQKAQTKLAAMRFYVAAPDHWRDYSRLDLKHLSFVQDLHTVQIFNKAREFDRIRSGSQEHRWFWTVPTADANYDENENDIEIPAGILQPPYLSERSSLAANYGAFGMLAGHEFTHGFDDSGSHYNENGKLNDWFIPQDKAGFEQMTSCEVAEYGHFEALPGLHLDSRLELGEITADNGGLRIAHDAFVDASMKGGHVVAQQEERDFFVAFAQIWCEKRRPEYQRMRGQTDPHPPGEFRVNGAVQNLDAFGAAFACRKGQPMAPASSCHVW